MFSEHEARRKRQLQNSARLALVSETNADVSMLCTHKQSDISTMLLMFLCRPSAAQLPSDKSCWNEKKSESFFLCLVSLYRPCQIKFQLTSLHHWLFLRNSNSRLHKLLGVTDDELTPKLLSTYNINILQVRSSFRFSPVEAKI